MRCEKVHVRECIAGEQLGHNSRIYILKILHLEVVGGISVTQSEENLVHSYSIVTDEDRACLTLHKGTP